MTDHDRPRRILIDGCKSCRYSKVYCQAMLSMVDGEPCCDDCSHRPCSG